MGFSLWNIFKVRNNDRCGASSQFHTYPRPRYPLPCSRCLLTLPLSLSLTEMQCNYFSHSSRTTQAGLLFTNSVLILNRKRFLAKHGLDVVNNMGCDPSERPLRVQVIGLLQAVQYLKLPMIAANLLTIIFELLLGGG